MVQCLASPVHIGLISSKKSTKGKGSKVSRLQKEIQSSTKEEEKTEEEQIEEDQSSAAAPEESKGGMSMQLALSAFSMVANHFITKIDFKNARTHKLARLAFVAYLLLSQLLVILLRARIEAADDQTELSTGPTGEAPLQMLARAVPGLDMLKGMLPAAQRTPQTVREYDLSEANKLSFGLISEALVTLYMDYMAKMPYLLLIVPLGSITSKLNSPIVQIHLLGRRAVGALSRPFRSGMMAALEGQQTTETVEETEGGEKAETQEEVEAQEEVEVTEDRAALEEETTEEEEVEILEEAEADEEAVAEEEVLPGEDLVESWPSLAAAAEEQLTINQSSEEEDEEA